MCVRVCVCGVCGAIKKSMSKSQSGLSEQRVICASSLEAVTELLQVGNPVEMDERRCHDQDMKNLMRVELEGVKERHKYQFHPLLFPYD